MRMQSTSNPALSKSVLERSTTSAGSGVMTVNGALNKTAILLLLVVLSAAYVWNIFYNQFSMEEGVQAVQGWLIFGAIGGFVVALVTIFKKDWAQYTAPVYALLEGLFLGGISAIFEAQYQGIVVMAVGLTFGTLFIMLLAYRAGWIKVTQKFRMGVVAATGGIAFVYFISIILGFFGIQLPMIHGSGFFGIGFSIFVVVIAALNLVLDFDFIEQAAQAGSPKHIEWYSAFGLMVTLVWLYIEILRLLSKIMSSD